MIDAKDLKFYREELFSDECFCGETKKPRTALCGKCYYRLPASMRKNLYLQVGNGYEDAYEEAVAWLD